jgi:ABC-type sulfate transport system permease subunit
MLQLLAFQESNSGSGAAGAIMGLIGLVYMAVIVLVVVSLWVIFTKAGQPGWAAIVPIYNAVVLLQIVGRPIWWVVLLLIPFVNFIVGILVSIDLAKSFGKGAGFGIGLVVLGFVFAPILAFGDARYQGPSAA